MMSQNPFIFSLFLSLFSNFPVANGSNGNPSAFDVGVILDINSAIGRVGWRSISMAVTDFYATHSNYKTRLALHLRDSQGDNIQAALAALDLVEKVGVQAIIGPQKSRQAEFVVDIGDKAQVPLISFSAANPLSFRTPYFIQATQNDSSQVIAVTAIVQAFKWKEVVVLYEDSDYGSRLIPDMIDSCQEIQARITYMAVISLSATDDQILEVLYKLRGIPTRVFIVHMSASLGSRFFIKAKEMGMMSDGYVWIIAGGLVNMLDSLSPSVIESMQGILGVRPFVKPSKRLLDFGLRWRRKFRHENFSTEEHELNIFGLRAYDSVWALAMAAEKVDGATSLSKKSKENNTAIDTSRNGSKLLDAISKIRFNGLSGNFHLLNGQLQSSIFQIVNVIGKGEGEIGYWTPKCGISRNLNNNCDKIFTDSIVKLRGIMWPGESMVAPKGWAIPTRGKKLKIGVPVKDAMREFVWGVEGNTRDTSGYIIDLFNSVMAALPYPVEYEFVPFKKSDGSSAGSYDDLVREVDLQRYDAAVADISITANRSLYADFSLPFTEGGVSMMVPIKHDENNNAWIFFAPLTKDLWLTAAAFFIFTGFVIWFLEHRINNAFRGPPAQHIGMIFWFPLTTFVFAHREKVVSNLTRFVVIIWIFVVLVLNSSYTANLSSMLTIQRLQPSVTTIQELIDNGDYVGFMEGSFLPDLLKSLKFDESKFKSFTSPQDLDEALLRGSQNGGISAFFSAKPYIELFVARYCDKYTMVDPIHKTVGFGFVFFLPSIDGENEKKHSQITYSAALIPEFDAFPKGSPLVADVSRVMLKLIEGSELLQTDRPWFKLPTTCSKNNAASHSLSFRSFRGLFIITGSVSGFALLVFLVAFLYKYSHVLTASDSENTLWLRLRKFFEQFDKKDPSSYDFKDNFDKARLTKLQDIEASPGRSRFTSTGWEISPLEGASSIDFEDSRTSTSALEDMVDVILSD